MDVAVEESFEGSFYQLPAPGTVCMGGEEKGEEIPF